MFRHTAALITGGIDEVVRKWVEVLRKSDRTEIHKQLLTAEIVDGVKAMLANLAETMAAGKSAESQRPEHDVPPADGDQPGGERSPALRATRPLASSWERAKQSAASHGSLRHHQGYELQEVAVEYAVLRKLIWELVLGGAGPPVGRAEAAALVPYLDALFDELLLISLENFYSTSIHDLERRAIRDPLTQLYNRDYFLQRLHQEVRRALRYDQSLTVVILDLDSLKPVNDTYGHPAGDAMIVRVSSAIRETSRQSDIPCRYGGDEFAIILPETGKSQARIFAERLSQALLSVTIVVAPGERLRDPDATPGGFSGPMGVAARLTPPNQTEPAGRSLSLPVTTVSIGLASLPEDARTPEMLLAKADGALYRAKREGRNRIVC